jgi:hypothetical protein
MSITRVAKMRRVGWIQVIGEKMCFTEGQMDPREVHDNGKPCFPVYAESPQKNEPRMGPYTSVFNGHVNNASARADAEFIKQFGQQTFDKVIKPFHKAGIMGLFNVPMTPHRLAWVTLVAAFVNENRV